MSDLQYEPPSIVVTLVAFALFFAALFYLGWPPAPPDMVQ